MSTHSDSNFRTLFSQMIQKPEEDIQLDRAALYLAGEEYPEIDVSSHLAELDAFAEQISLRLGRVSNQAAPADLARAIARYLFDEVGFHGNQSEYYDADNSFLNRVLETRSGIPITLSLIFLEVGRRLGLRCSGVGLPGHFIVGLDGSEEYLDPFNAGTILSAGDCRNLVHQMSGGRMEWSDDFLAAYSKHDLLFRILNNLKSVHMQSGQWAKAVGVIQRMALINPDLPSLYQEQAWCHAQQQQYRLAIKSLETYSQKANNPADAKRAKDQINGLWATLSRLN